MTTYRVHNLILEIDGKICLILFELDQFEKLQLLGKLTKVYTVVYFNKIVSKNC